MSIDKDILESYTNRYLKNEVEAVGCNGSIVAFYTDGSCEKLGDVPQFEGLNQIPNTGIFYSGFKEKRSAKDNHLYHEILNNNYIKRKEIK